MSTLSIHARGRFELLPPFNAKKDVIYEVTAIREFSDLYLQGIDVYTHYYEKLGIREGVDLNGKLFSFDDEVKNNPAIVTLEGTDRTVIYVPTTFIVKYPEVDERLLYSRMILSADLGILPDDVNLDTVSKEVEELVSKRVGKTAKVVLTKAISTTQPTIEDHIKLENTRKGNIKSMENNFSELEKYKKQNQQLQKQIETLTRILVENGLL